MYSTALWPGSRVKKNKITYGETSHFGYTSQSTLRIQNVTIGPLEDFEKRGEKTILDWPKLVSET